MVYSFVFLDYTFLAVLVPSDFKGKILTIKLKDASKLFVLNH